jgi:hypothetical protein
MKTVKHDLREIEMTTKTHAKHDIYVSKALELFETGVFANKTKKKDAMGYLNSAYHTLTNQWTGIINWDTGVQNAPFDIHAVREKHMDYIEGQDETHAQLVRNLVALRAEMKDAEVAPKKERDTSVERTLKFIGIDPSRFADRPLASEAFAVLREMEPEEIKGFRSQHFMTFTAWDVVNEFGTHFYRHMFYLNGKREAFAVAMSFVSADFDHWLLNGKPDMSKMGLADIKNFYNKEAA